MVYTVRDTLTFTLSLSLSLSLVSLASKFLSFFKYMKSLLIAPIHKFFFFFLKIREKTDMAMNKKLSKPELEKLEMEMVKLNPAAELADGFYTKPWLNKQKLGSVIPKKRKSVKRMVFERLAQIIVQVFSTSHPSSSGASSLPSKTCCCFNKGEAIHPHTP